MPPIYRRHCLKRGAWKLKGELGDKKGVFEGVIDTLMQTMWLPLLLEILDDMCIVIICCPCCGITNFEINLIFHIKSFS